MMRMMKEKKKGSEAGPFYKIFSFLIQQTEGITAKVFFFSLTAA